MRRDLGSLAFEGEDKSARRPNPVDVHVGSRVRMRRMILGLSQEKLGERLGLTFQQIQKYEKGVNRIGASRLYDLSRVLGVGVEFFFAEIEDPDSERTAADGQAASGDEAVVVSFLKSREGIDLNRAFARIGDAKVRRSVIDLVRSLSDDG
ncbi:MAG: helix-turn-helix transcriptional regulator [Pseudomonadota bacterium]